VSLVPVSLVPVSLVSVSPVLMSRLGSVLVRAGLRPGLLRGWPDGGPVRGRTVRARGRAGDAGA
jgi:hypothetical protein